MSLKDQNKPVKIIAFFLLAVLYSWIVETPIIDVGAAFDGAGLKGLVNTKSLIFISLSIASLALDGLAPKHIKEKIVHRRFQNPLPGCRAFTDIAQNDSRIDMDAIEAKYGPLPTAPAEQNKTFYKISKSCQDAVGVKDAHRSYLLFRDLSFDTYVLSILATIYTAIFGVGVFKAGIVLVAGIGAAFLLSVIATNFAHRFVCNVLAQAQ